MKNLHAFTSGNSRKTKNKRIYTFDASPISIPFRDAGKYTVEEIIKSIEAVERLNSLAEK
ncbi:MAG: hypothetical protein AYK19_08450 [Theionarchaea archaeon DG-70-1]|nr:MAG: hypothetical protein AYK19_08450 [Theionarchaea archaeon DG-70-1]